MTECVFCSVVSRRDRGICVYDDDDVLAFMDRNPINTGHVLVIPKIHVPDLQKLDEAIYVKIMLIARRIALALDDLYAPTKVGFAVAGFDVPHAHLHIIPLHDYHDLTSQYYLDASSKKPAPMGLAVEAAKIRRLMGVDMESEPNPDA